MAQLQLPFTLSSHPTTAPVKHDSDHRSLINHPSPSFSTYPVLRLSDSQRTSKQPLQVIVTVPGQGWSIHKVSDQTILSSQKVSPSLIFTAPSVALSIPRIAPAEQQSERPAKLTSEKSRKTRTRYIYAAIASCSSDPSPAVNQGRTIWVWIENEVSGGFGERDDSNGDPGKSSSASIIKEFHSRVETIYPLPPTDPNGGSTTQLARILVLLQSGEVLLCDEKLTTIATCRLHCSPPPSISTESPHVRIQTYNNNHESDATSNLIRRTGISIASVPGLMIYISRLKPEFPTSSEQLPNGSTPKGRSKKRKSVATQSSKPPSSRLSHYSHLEICILELQSDKLHSLGRTSHKEDFLDVAIGAQGWITIMARSHVLSTYILSHSPSSAAEVELLPSRDLTLMPHPQCSAMQLAAKFRSVEMASPSSTSTPVLVALPCSIPLVLVFMSHSTQPSTDSTTSCLGLVLDLYHQAVLFVLQSPWPTAPKHSHSSPSDYEPMTVSATLSTSSQPPHVYICLSYPSIRIVQVLQAPEFPPDGPTWIEVLNPVVTDATFAWIIPESNGAIAPAQTVPDRQKNLLLSDSLLDAHSFVLQSDARTEKATHPQRLRSFISRFNDICAGNTKKTGHWDFETVRAAEIAWAECILTPLSGQEGSETQDVIMAGDDSSEHATDKLVAEFLRGAKVASKLGSMLSKAFIQVLLQICLGQFAAEVGKDLTVNLADGSASSSGNKSKSSKPYPVQIVNCLLHSGFVEQSMVSGGLIPALRRAGDATAVEVAISKLFDVDESELVETIRWAIRFHNSSPPASKSEGVTDRKPPLFHRLLAKIVSQPLSPGPLKKALKEILSTNDILIVFRVLNQWIDWWLQEGLQVLRLDCKSSQTSGNLTSNPNPNGEASDSKNAHPPSNNTIGYEHDSGSNKSGLPGLRRILEFVECSLDAHLIGLIQYKQANSILKALKSKLKQEIEIDNVLQMLNGTLTQSVKLSKEKQLRQKKKLEISSKQKGRSRRKSNPVTTMEIDL
ncbi:hypothetical protein PtB15_9B57 [Puccinia triticina]|nr:hypothetical protein PtB15_9B57 [Puccinia triticina]